MKHSRTLLALLLPSLLLVPASAQESATPREAATSSAPAAAKAVRAAKAAKNTAEPVKPAGSLGDIQLTQVRLDEAARLLSQIARANIVVTGSVADKVVSLYLHDATVEDMLRNLCRAAGVWYRFDPSSKTHVVMSGAEYQKDLAIVRDEQTSVFTLRHHNVVAAANAIRALYGSRVALAIPIEETPPVSLGSGNRVSTGGNRTGTSGSGSGSTSGSGSNTGNNMGNNSNLMGGSFNQSAMGNALLNRSGVAGGAATNYDPRSDLGRLGQERIDQQIKLDEDGRPVVGITDIQDAAARQGPTIYVTYNKLNNLLLVRSGDDEALRQIARLIQDMDKPPRQVLLEMKILEVTLDDGFRSVFDIGSSGKSKTSGPLTTGALGSTSTYARNSLQTGLFDVEQDATAIWQIMSDKLSLRFQLLAQENKLKVLSSPMLVAANNQLARLFIGDERVLTVGASSASTTGTTGATNTTITVETEKRDVGQTLSILPRINGDRSVSLTIDQDSSTVKLKDATIPIATANGDIYYFPIDTVNTANLQVTAHAMDGMTVAVGGMIRDSIERDEEKVPVLGDIPIVGTFFKRDVRASVRSQIVLLITPRVLEKPEDADRVAQKKTQDFNALGATIPTTPILPKLSNTPSALPASGIASGRDGDTSFAALARAAASTVRQKDPTAAPQEGLSAVPLPDHQRIALADGIEARPSASWQRDGLYVTALQLINLGSQPKPLAATLIRGRWAAIVLEKSRLEASGSAGSWAWAYAISRQPFEQSVERQ
ncbi:secretin N-terminal domain-containing protein [Rhodocyclus tenuis]|uniref:General secretion pathway protein D n=1 Tax=Rhodocyclus tenuis TaxID=1066 RepID=A0A840GDJ5_RHOTE|nr:secretin N-terminal domain-containing protein [Rhodocyclus tenuis]MBB4248708.1 general secretion pathway protein D [Rhodocyclus tenuis]